jgi:hypothetical protein
MARKSRVSLVPTVPTKLQLAFVGHAFVAHVLPSLMATAVVLVGRLTMQVMLL